jgi:hypothetical protein
MNEEIDKGNNRYGLRNRERINRAGEEKENSDEGRDS